MERTLQEMSEQTKLHEEELLAKINTLEENNADLE